MKKSKLNSGMEQLVTENTGLKQENEDLHKINRSLLDLADAYDRELNDTVAVLKHMTEELNTATDIIKRMTADDDKTDTVQ
jgi:regulator of replication initiation timing